MCLVLAVEAVVALLAADVGGGCESKPPGVVCHDVPAVVQLDQLRELHAWHDDEARLRSPIAAPTGLRLRPE